MFGHLRHSTRFMEVLAAIVLSLGLWWMGSLSPSLTAVHVVPRPIVVLDPGHGGRDPGAISRTGVMEKHINLAIAQAVARILRGSGVVVYLTRTQDQGPSSFHQSSVFNDLMARSRLARQFRATLFVTIHSNWEPSHTAHGPIVYYDAASPSSALLAAQVAKAFVPLLGYDRPTRPIRQLVLQQVTMPAINVEVGFLSHSQDSRLLVTPQYQETLASSIAKGILAYLRSRGLSY